MIVAQLVVAAAWEVPFDHTRNTISDLGAVGCGTLQAAGGPVEVCSPWHAGMNASFVVIGALLTLGGALAAPYVVRRAATSGRAARGAAGAAMLLLVVAGASSVAVGLVPLDVDVDLHALVATPVFVVQPLALLLLGALLLARGRRAWGAVVLGLGLLATAGTIAFAVSLATGDVGGLYERVALWPGNLGVAVVGWTVLSAGVPRRPPVWETAA